jgi:hypothetical protein
MSRNPFLYPPSLAYRENWAGHQSDPNATRWFQPDEDRKIRLVEALRRRDRQQTLAEGPLSQRPLMEFGPWHEELGDQLTYSVPANVPTPTIERDEFAEMEQDPEQMRRYRAFLRKWGPEALARHAPQPNGRPRVVRQQTRRGDSARS